MKRVYDDDGRLHLCLFVVPDKIIDVGTELRYSYGDGEDFHWRKKKDTQFPFKLIDGKVFSPLNRDIY
jgi:hypothetical protein